MLKGLWRAILSSSLLATMCCFPSVILVLFGLSSVSAAASLSDTLYWGGEGWGWFRPTLLAVSAATLAAGVVLHFRRSGVCTLEEAVRQRRAIVNTTLLAFSVATTLYLVVNYVLLTEAGIAVGLPWESSRFWTK
jgi:hypothetical protein